MARKIKLLVLLCALLLMAVQAFAHERNYVWTEMYRTIPKGSWELEGWTTFKMPNTKKTNTNSFEYQGELEYGLTDRWTIAMYQRWKTDNKTKGEDATTYQGFKFETKYRIGEKGKYWLDPLIYLEWVTNPQNRHNPNKIEGKIVLSKDIERFNFTYNQIMESTLGSGGRTEHNYAVGASYEIFDDIKIGAEIKGNYWRPSSHKNKISVGPTISWANKYFWVATGVAFGANKHADDVEARVLVGVPF